MSALRARASRGGTPLDQNLLASVRARLGADFADRTTGDLAAAEVSSAIAATGQVLGSEALRELTIAARAELTGAGPLQVLLERPDVTDVLVNGPREVWIDRGNGLERTDFDLGQPTAVRTLAQRLAAIAGQRLDDAAPICDGRLSDGTRLHAVIEPISANGTVISLRVLRQHVFTLDALAERGAFPAELTSFLRAVVAGRANVLISGGTGTGKTTLLAALLGLVGGHERIITVEEASELQPNHAHVVSLVSRRANVEGAGAVELSETVRAALRMRPDRLVVGECRGPEVREMLLAMNTGHDGGLATVHANAVEYVPARLEALAALAGMTREALGAQAIAALDVVIHLVRRAGRRYIAAIGRPELDQQVFVVRPAVEGAGSGAMQVVDAGSWQALQRRWSA
jgi:pilus assembly protein CpaF